MKRLAPAGAVLAAALAWVVVPFPHVARYTRELRTVVNVTVHGSEVSVMRRSS